MKQAKRLLTFVLAFALVLASALSMTSCGEEASTAYLVIEDYGMVTIELYKDKAPITVENFTKLVNEGFYDGLTFHRIIEQFMIQGGCPKGDGTGDSGTDITGEFANNGRDTGLKHVEGTISMARSGHPYEAYHNAGYVDIPFEQRAPYYNSASSQFFIVTETSENNSLSLDGNYAAFGRVTEGMEVIKAVAAVKTDADDKPLTPIKIAVITFDKAEAETALNNTK